MKIEFSGKEIHYKKGHQKKHEKLYLMNKKCTKSSIDLSNLLKNQTEYEIKKN